MNNQMNLQLLNAPPVHPRDDVRVRPPRRAAPSAPPVGPHEVEVRGERVEGGVDGAQQLRGERRRRGGLPREGGEVGHGRQRGQQAQVRAALRVLLKGEAKGKFSGKSTAGEPIWFDCVVFVSRFSLAPSWRTRAYVSHFPTSYRARTSFRPS